MNTRQAKDEWERKFKAFLDSRPEDAPKLFLTDGEILESLRQPDGGGWQLICTRSEDDVRNSPKGLEIAGHYFRHTNGMILEPSTKFLSCTVHFSKDWLMLSATDGELDRHIKSAMYDSYRRTKREL